MPLNISGSTQIIALYGRPVKHSLSPIMQNCAFNELNLDYVYIALEPESIEGGILAARELKISGLNITSPFKVKAINYVDDIDDTASNASALNTIYWHNDQFIGSNTDVKAIENALLDQMGSTSGCKVLIAGAGGVARAVIASLPESPIKLFNRNPSTRKEIVKLFNNRKIHVDDISKISNEIPEADILVNATPIGSKTNDSIFNFFLIDENHVVLDLVYRQGGTKLIKEASMRGAKTVDGGEILVLQGAESFKLWTGKKAPVKVMRTVVRRALE